MTAPKDWNTAGFPYVVSPLSYSPIVNFVVAANTMYACRCFIRETGTIARVFTNLNISSGNVDFGIVSVAAEPRTVLYTAGSTACPAAGITPIASPSLAVQAGDIYDFVIAFDNNVASIQIESYGVAMAMVTNDLFWPTGSASLKLCWSKATSFPIPVATSTITDASLTTQTRCPWFAVSYA